MNRTPQMQAGVDAMKDSTLRSNGHEPVQDLKSTQNQCVMCGKIYQYAITQAEFREGKGSTMEREQHISGICSDACWNSIFS